MSNDTKYEGWTNYETWVVNLWMGNDQGSYEYWREVAQEFLNERKDDPAIDALSNITRALAERIKEQHEGANPVEREATVYTDLMRGALSVVKWYNIAESLIDAELEDQEYEKQKANGS